ncbi:ABC transporter permease subunit [Paenibacillus sacheonensis]|uniref:ABC transporter permease subunit n=1 Tax=Paenibacillus sacheonensis TaxID=742054 RepID=A0A7X5C0Z3_9BACL|nr:raffinose/stachyose/melibiose transport system permease protein [Paenibacillus sacheonensis]NBC72106.1 ABC transporter permease subunit [Paenibacillus sacheonensis]
MNVLKVPARTIAVFVLPCLLIYIGLVFVPIIVSVYDSTLNWDGINTAKHIGIDNFKTMFAHDANFWPAVRHTLMYAVFSMLEIPICLFVAALMNRYVKKANTLVSIYFVPVILSTVIIGQLWKTVYNPAEMGGMLNGILNSIGLDSWTRSWLTEPKIAMYCLYVVSLWQYFGYHLLIQFTGVQNIPQEVYEAAKIDGAEGFKSDWYITYPMAVPIFKISIVLAFIGSLQSFDLVWVMTGGGPAHATDTIATLMYTSSFSSNQYGYGSAIATFLVVMCLVVTVIINAVFKKVEAKYS